MGEFWDSVKNRLGMAPAPARPGAESTASAPAPAAPRAPESSRGEVSAAAAAEAPRPVSAVGAQPVEGQSLAGVLNAELHRVGTRANRLVGKPPPRDPVDGVLNEDGYGWKSFKDGVLNSGQHAWAAPFPVLNAGGYRWRSH